MKLKIRLNVNVLLLIVVLSSSTFLLTSVNSNAQTTQEVPLKSKTIRGPLPVFEPASEVWSASSPLQIPLAWQNITKPMLLGPSVKSLLVRSINNGTWIAFLVEWSDKTRDYTVSSTEGFRDGAAVMFPLGNGTIPPFLGMGEVGKPVNIWHWKADWQEDIDVKFQELEKTHPNMWVNYYPFTSLNSTSPVPPISSIDPTFLSGIAAGNLMSNPIKTTPIEDLIAEGFGTLTTQPRQDVTGKGVWENGLWKVVFARPMSTSDPADAQFLPRMVKPVTFAVWEGGNKEVDGRKSFSNWHTMQVEAGVFADVEEGLLVPVGLWRWLVVGAVFLLGFSILALLGSDKLRGRQRS